jgi:hypothetical protein
MLSFFRIGGVHYVLAIGQTSRFKPERLIHTNMYEYCENSYNIFLMLSMELWVPIFAMLCKRAVPMLWRASLLLGLMCVP